MGLGIWNLHFFYFIFATLNKGRRGRAARHRSAKPRTPVRIRAMPLTKNLSEMGGFFIEKKSLRNRVLGSPEVSGRTMPLQKTAQ